MQLVSILFFAVSANMDNFIIGISYGIKKIKIHFYANLVIAAITCAGTVISMLIGKALGFFLPERLGAIFGSVILISMGFYYIFKYVYNLVKKKFYGDWPIDHPEKFDKDNSGNIDLKESVVLGIALTLNNTCLGIGASIGGYNIAVSAGVIFIMSILTIFLGNMIGKSNIFNILEKYGDLVSGLIILTLGVSALR